MGTRARSSVRPGSHYWSGTERRRCIQVGPDSLTEVAGEWRGEIGANSGAWGCRHPDCRDAESSGDCDVGDIVLSFWNGGA